ncbi:hAT family dimerization domain protein [Fusarium oxysporum f. sp. phaseoli]
MVKKLWEEKYKSSPTLSTPNGEPPLKRLKVMSALERHLACRTSSLPDETACLKGSWDGDYDEYDHWLRNPDAKHDPLVTDPLRYWWEKRKDYPRLSRMALDVLSIPPMSAECERLFSVAGQMVSPLGTRLEASTIGMTQTLRSWVRSGLIEAGDALIDVSEETANSIKWQSREG